MKVKEIMETKVDFVTTSTNVKQICHIIFERGVNGVPVCKDRKVVGFITERDVLAKFFPTMQEFVEDPIHESNFENMEQKISYIFSLTADKIMSKEPVIINQDAALLEAQSVMFVNKVGRLPVVDEKGNLVGILSKGDIFKTVVGEKLALGDEEGFFDWLANYYDYAIDWKGRLAAEIPSLVKVLKKGKVKKVIDVACSTGEHSIALVKEGFEVVGLDSSGRMVRLSNSKKAKLKEDVREKVQFIKGYHEPLNTFPKDFDAAIFMGNALPHVIVTDSDILNDVTNIINPEKGILVFQIANFDKVLKNNRGFREFGMRHFGLGFGENHAFLSFYTKGKGKSVMTTRAIFDSNGEKWSFRGMNDTEILYIGRKEIESMLRKLGFKEIEFYGSHFMQPIFKDSFDPNDSDWLNVVAKR